VAATDVEIARLPANIEMKRPARSLWGDAWHQFTRNRLVNRNQLVGAGMTQIQPVQIEQPF